MDIPSIVLEEVALDGLDGITLESLWYRLNRTCPKFPLNLDDKAQAYLWNTVIVKLRDVEFYMLETPREPLTDPVPEIAENGIELYRTSPLIKLLPCCFISNDKEKGSCSTYNTRVNVTTQVRDEKRQALLSYEEVKDKWKDRLVIVASQAVREMALFKDATDPRMIKLTSEMYCNLEHIAKGRYEGVYGGDAFAFLSSLKSTKVTHGLMGYLRKKLKGYEVISQTSQVIMKENKGQLRLAHENICHLKRFQRRRKTLYNSFHDNIERFLLDQPYREYYLADLCSVLNLPRRKVQKFLKVKPQHFELVYVREADLLARSSTLQKTEVKSEPDVNGLNENSMDIPALGSTTPNGSTTPAGSTTPVEAGMSSSVTTVVQETGDKKLPSAGSPKKKAKKAKSVSRNLLVVRLKQTQEEFEEAEAAKSECGEVSTFSPVPVKRAVRNMNSTMFVQIKDWIDSLGPQGATKRMLREAFGLHTLQSRHIMKNIAKQKSFHLFFAEHKRQKVERMCSLKYASHHISSSAARNLSEELSTPAIEAVSSTCIKVETPGAGSGEKAAGTSTKAAASSGKRSKGDGGSMANRQVTDKTVERQNTIISLARQHRLILFPDLNKLILASEADKYDTKIDRRTLKRLCEHLHRTNQIRIFKTLIEVETKSRDLFYICDPSMTLDNKLMMSSLESQRSELTSYVKGSGKDEKGAAKAKEEASKVEYTMNKTISVTKYGYAAQMKRAATLHQFLCYLVYNYEGRTDLGSETDENGKFISSNGELSKMNVYLDQENWKRFLPPRILSPDKDSDGRACLLDLGAQLPLDIFLILVRMPYEVPFVMDYLDHPIKRHIPVRHLPMSMRAPLLHKMKYIPALRDTVAMLCMMGLATNISTADGGITYREISVIYLHKESIVVDTSIRPSTGEGVEPDKAETFCFDLNKGMYLVDQYWMALRNVCTSTPLRRVEKPQAKSLDEPEVVRHDKFREPRLKEAFSPKAIEDVQEGIIPGDGKGAGGLDTLFFANLGRQWNSQCERLVPSASAQVDTPSDKQLSKAGCKRTWQNKATTVVTPTTVPLKPDSHAKSPSKTKKVLTVKRRAVSDQRLRIKKLRAESDTPKPSKSVIKKQKYEARRAKDEKDYIAETHLETQRSLFTPREDEALMLAKIGLNILGCKEVASKPIRDFIHRYLPTQSRDKSSAACWARVCRLLQFGRKERTMHLYTSIAMNDPAIAAFKDQEPQLSSETFSTSYQQLMDLVLDRCGNASHAEVAIDLSSVSGIEELTAQYNLIVVTEAKEKPKVATGHAKNHAISPPVVVKWSSPSSDKDIAHFALTNFCLSYLLTNDKVNRTYQMHKVFEQYPSWVVDLVLLKLQANKVATIKKTAAARSLRRFCLSYRYKLFAERIQVISMEIFESCAHAMSELEKVKDGDVHEYVNVDDWRGRLILLLTLSPHRAIDIEFDLPKKVLDTSNVQQSDDEDEGDEEDLVNESSSVSARDRKCRMRFEHCQIKPCTVRARLQPDNFPYMLRATKIEDRQYARTLMSTVPYDVNKEKLYAEVEESIDEEKRPILQAVYDFINNAAVNGVSFLCILSHVQELFPLCTIDSLQQLMQALLDRSLILSVGITHVVYVTHDNCRVWVVHSLRDTKGRGTGVELDDDDKVALADVTKISPTPGEGSQSKSLAETVPAPSSTFHRVDIIPRPWLTPEGTINYQILHHVLTSVISTINKHQSIKFEALHKLLSMVYAPILLLEILQILEHLGCVSCEYLVPTTTSRPSLFSKRRTYTLTEDIHKPNAIAHYTVRHEAMQRISIFMRNTSLRHSTS